MPPTPFLTPIFMRRVILFLAVVFCGLGADLWTKTAVFRMLGMPNEREPSIYWVIPNVLGFETALNQGALFGIGQGFGLLFCAISILALLLILVWLFVFGYAKSLLWTCSLGMISAGILGNMVDRLGLHGLKWHYTYENAHEMGKPVYAVRDWIVVMLGSYHWPNFNIADSLLVCGAILVCLATYFLETPEAESEKTEAGKSGE